MNYDLITLVSKLRQVETLEQLKEVRELAESFMRREKNFALLTLMAVGEELGEEEIAEPLEKLHRHLRSLEEDLKSGGKK